VTDPWVTFAANDGPAHVGGNTSSSRHRWLRHWILVAELSRQHLWQRPGDHPKILAEPVSLRPTRL